MKKEANDKDCGKIILQYKDKNLFNFKQYIDMSLKIDENTEIYSVMDLFIEFLVKVGFSQEAIDIMFGVEDYDEDDILTSVRVEPLNIVHDKDVTELLNDNEWVQNIIKRINMDGKFAKDIISVYINYLQENKN